MIRFIRSRIPAHDAKKPDKEEFFHFSKTLQHGFPSKASSFAYDQSLSLLAIGTKNGLIRVVGTPGVEWMCQTPQQVAVRELFFIPNEARIITLCIDQSFHLFEINGVEFDHVAVKQEHKLKQIRACTMQTIDNEHRLLIGTEIGNIYGLDTKSLELTDLIIYQDTVEPSVPDEKKSASQVESLAVFVDDLAKLLIGYNSGLIVLYDTVSRTVCRSYITEKAVECVCWHSNGRKFASSHNDGSYIVWSVDDSSKPMHSPNIPFGPFPCMSVSKLIWKSIDVDDDELVAFSGGMPRASYGDRFTVSVQKKDQQVVFDLATKVVDFLIIDKDQNPAALFILCEEELVAVDLAHPDWGVFRLAYLYPIHSSPITAAYHVAQAEEAIVNKLIEFGKEQFARRHFVSDTDWPIVGGQVIENDQKGDLIVTGHEDGTVKIWLSTSLTMKHLLTIPTAKCFQGYIDPFESHTDDDDGLEWPPFRKIGLYDPFSDDPRYSVQRVCFDGKNGTLFVGASAGQVVVFELASREQKLSRIDSLRVPIVDEEADFVWKGHQELSVLSDVLYPTGFQPVLVIQAIPPAAITSICCRSDLHLVSFGTAYGYALCDYRTKCTVFFKCLLSAVEMASHNASTLEGAMSRFKSFKKSLRDSFRRRRRRDVDSPTKKSPILDSDGEVSSSTPKKPGSPRRPVRIKQEQDTYDDEEEEEGEVKPVERAVEARRRAMQDGPLSLVRSIAMPDTFVSGLTKTPTLWVGTNGGSVLVHLLTINDDVDEKEEHDEQRCANVKCKLAKEIKLKHAAPVLAIGIVGSDDSPVNQLTSGPHRVIICSEEQIKSFSLPHLKPGKYKFKLTGLEGSRIRKIAFTKLQSVIDANKWENFIVLVTNQGEINAFSMHNFRRYIKGTMTKATDVHGILSTILTEKGEGFYLKSRGCEWQRLAIGAKHSVRKPSISKAVNNTETAISNEHRRDIDGSEANNMGNGSPILRNDTTLDSIIDFTSPIGVVNSSEGVVTITTRVVNSNLSTQEFGDVIVVDKDDTLMNGTTSSEPSTKPTSL